jgi:FG-GAP-like repeat
VDKLILHETASNRVTRFDRNSQEGTMLRLTSSTLRGLSLVAVPIGAVLAVGPSAQPQTQRVQTGLLRSFEIMPLETVSETSSNASIGDVNGDGHPDIVLVKGRQVYFNDGHGNFEHSEPWGPANGSIRAMAVADFDGDGHLDIAACPEQLGCFVYFGDGKGHFSSSTKFQEPEALPYSMIAADLNRDGRPEILVGYVNAPGIVYFNDGTGRRFQSLKFGDGKGAIYGMAAGDLNGDGWPDVAVARSDAPSFVMFSRPQCK